MYEQFYGFAEPPFSLAPDPKFFFHWERHAQAFDLVRYGIGRGEGFIVVYGEIGTGKSILCRKLIEAAPPEVRTALVSNPFLSEADLLRAILQDFGARVEEKPREGRPITKQDLVAILNSFLLSIQESNGRAVVLIDEAQNLPVATIEQLRILSNLETAKQKLLQIVLVGRSELKRLLARPELRQLSQRVSIRCELRAFSLKETTEYIRHRMLVASHGNCRALFAQDALKLVQRYSRGIPRMINLIADRCLTAGMTAGSTTIDATMANRAVKALEFDRARWWKEKRPVWAWIGAVGLVALGLMGLWLSR